MNKHPDIRANHVLAVLAMRGDLNKTAVIKVSWSVNAHVDLNIFCRLRQIIREVIPDLLQRLEVLLISFVQWDLKTFVLFSSLFYSIVLL